MWSAEQQKCNYNGICAVVFYHIQNLTANDVNVYAGLRVARLKGIC